MILEKQLKTLEKLIAFYWKLGFNLVAVEGKHPISKWKHWQDQRQSWEDVATQNWDAATGIAAISGKVSSNLVCLDLDKLPDNTLLTALLSRLGLGFDYQWIVKTGSGVGNHVWIRTDENLSLGDNLGNVQLPAKSGGILDLRWNQHYALLPPSVHPDTKNEYSFINGYPENQPAYISAQLLLKTFEALTVPKSPAKNSALVPKNSAPNGNGWNDDFEQVYIEKALAAAIDTVVNAPESERNNTLYQQTLKMGGYLGRGGLDQIRLTSEMFVAALSAGLSDSEIKRTIASALKTAKPREIPAQSNIRNGNGHSSTTDDSQALGGIRNLTDYGNAERLIDKYGDYIRYCSAWKAWLGWNKTRWQIDETGVIMRMAKNVVRMIDREVEKANTDAQRDNIRKWARKSESAGKLGAMITLAQTESGISILPDEFDSNQMLLNATNGIVDLRTGDLLPHDKTRLLMKQVAAAYDPLAKCPTWLNFLDQIMAGNQNLIDFLQKAIGYSLTGQTGEQVMFILYGGGSNGKSTLLEILRHLLADYSLNTPTSTIMRRADSSSTTNNDVARLRGARFVSAVETEENQQLAESTIKQITGGDTITARFLFGEFFEFKPTFKLWLAANHKPQIAGGDHGIWRRIRLIPFTVKITDEMKDIHLPEKLKAEIDGILAWAVEGCLKWQAEGLGMPEEVAAAVEEYRAEMDVLAAFLDDCCVALATASVSASDLYKKYQSWVIENGITAALSQRKFGGKLKDRGFESIKSTGGRYIWRGIGLMADVVD